jgi:ribose transport system ATP-binding protein
VTVSPKSPGVPLRLAVRGVTKTYGRVRALDDVSFEVRVGEVMALLGQNGAGKSTLVKILSGLVQPDGGEIRIDGAPVVLGTSKRAQEAGVAVVQQEISAVGNMSVAENLVLGQLDAPWLWTRRRLAGGARALLDRVGLAELDPSTRIEELSVAEMQLVEVARVLAREARIVIFDEPTAALSDVEIERVLALVRNLADTGHSVVYVTHRLGEVFRVCDRVTVFRSGRSQPAEPTDRLDVHAVVKKMIGREPEALYPGRGKPAHVVLEFDGLTAPGLSRAVSLRVRAGEILGLTGQLGSGAGVVVKALAGEAPGAAGDVALNGEPLSLRSRAAGAASGVAYCSSDRKRDGFFANLSMARNLSSPWISRVAPQGVISARREVDAATTAATSFALDPARMRSHVGLLSGGNQQKVALGKWLGASPRVLLVEEPTRGVDVGARAEIYARLRALCDEGMAIVVATSDTEEVLGLSDTVAAFYAGRVTAVRDAEDWSEGDLLRAVMHEDETPTPELVA